LILAGHLKGKQGKMVSFSQRSPRKLKAIFKSPSLLRVVLASIVADAVIVGDVEGELEVVQ
jgi:hypothetical protein